MAAGEIGGSLDIPRIFKSDKVAVVSWDSDHDRIHNIDGELNFNSESILEVDCHQTGSSELGSVDLSGLNFMLFEYLSVQGVSSDA
ncbi:hypothetical protein D5R81_20040 [Parashewanella spongiae]|uniref:Uncharacterized protein n=1 Tax=Parashewanella spongiae TaxID=342950 RepID=A0A3A6T7K2_9GAMM|nr:hypothetical protein [Parashewanella spongiae]MCL1080315.1 hypothetical protein [Parashewanella spongiae]RJY00945.1 hypothetical protein D5R81_20040 [Parashewanella spongiae]